MNTKPFAWPRTTLASAISMILAGGMSTAYGQQAAEGQNQSAVEEVTVTGSRIRRDDYSAVNATVVVTAEDMINLGLTSAAEMIAQLPSNVATNTAETNTDSNYFLGANIANLRGLNTFFGTRTLTLFNSRRFPATNNGGGVDLNFIPNALISRVETVTGGASATYGADALAGVINILLDQDIEEHRINLSYKTTSEGDGDNVDFSYGTGFKFLDDRASMQIGVDHMFQEAIDDCTTRDFCRASRGLLQNGTATAAIGQPAPPPYSNRNSQVVLPGQPQFIVVDGLRYATPSTGIIFQGGPPYYTFNEAGNDIIPIYDNLTPAELAIVTSQGADTRGGDSPYGIGDLTYAGVPLLPETTRDNVYARFAFELESGIEIDTEISYGESQSISMQNSVRRSGDIAGIEIQPENGFLLLGSPAMQAELLRRMPPPPIPLATFTCGFLSPYRIGVAKPTTCYNIDKHFAAETDQRNESTTEVARWALGANGSLFEGGTWTWDTYLSLGRADTRTEVHDWPSLNRRNMAFDSVLDQNGQPICRVLYDDPNDPNDVGDRIRDRWLAYFDDILGDDDDAAERQVFFDSLSAGCAPLNPFGHGMSPAARAYAFPAIAEGSQITQHAISLALSGDAWEGLAAGALRMAAGLDINAQETENFGGDDPITARDFYIQYGDAWGGKSTNTEAFVEFELPLLRDVPGADYLMVNVSDRRVRNESARTSGTPVEFTRYTSSWKASMVWQPVEILSVRLTRSSDARAPSARELYETSTPSTAFTNVTDIANPFRVDDPNTPDDEQTDGTQFTANGGASPGGNSALKNEQAITQTLGLVFAPGGRLDGLRASIDYNETFVKNAIEEISWQNVPSRCAFQVQSNLPPEQQTFCAQLEFGVPDPTQDPTSPYYQYTNIENISGSKENAAPYWSRSIDYSVSYFKQLAGGGSLNARVIATRYLEQSRDLGGFFARQNVAGQTGSNGLAGANTFPGQSAGFGVNYAPTPEIAGNLWLTYQKSAFSVTSQLRYVGAGRLNLQDNWISEGEVGHYTDPATGAEVYVPYAANLTNTISDSELPSWATLNLNLRYDFNQSRLAVDRFNGLHAFLNITNVGDRIPNFFSGTGPGGINTTFFSVLGRQYELGVEMRF
jgi:outer membrane receptor protein involved in Fe transport